MVHVFYYDFPPVGLMGIGEDEQGICAVFFADAGSAREQRAQEKNRQEWVEKETALIRKTAEQLREYFAGKRREFQIPLSLKGTAFQLADWEALRTIPYGETCSYRDIAEKIGRPAACRAVGRANHCNPVSILVPCHRVIGKNGELVGYGGGLSVKKYLLELERRAKQ